MGRGGARAKASGGTLTGEGPLISQSLSLNLTLFQFLQTGYFEKDLLSYCANRLAEYSCIYWLNPNVDEETEAVELHTAAYQTENVGFTTPADAEFTKYPSHFINMDRDKPTGVTVVHTLTDGQPITGTFLGPVNVREVLLSEHGTSVAVVESNRLPLDAVARVILPFLLVLACFSNLFLLRTAYKLSRRRLPLAIYFVYITLLDQIDLFARGTDYLVEAYGGIRLFTAVQFLDRSACQLQTMIHSGLRHVHAALLIGFAIDTWRFARSPHLYAAVYRREWTRNVLILSAVLAITIDSQFLWTFDLSLLHTKTLHERLVRKACECGFSSTTTLSPLFLNVIWPMIDHMWTEIIPCVVCGFLGTFALIMLRLRRRCQISATDSNAAKCDSGKQQHAATATSDTEGDQEKRTSGDYFKNVVYRWFDGHTIHEAPKAYALVVIIDSVFIVPRAIYYLTKYAMFANFHVNRVGSQFFGYDTQPDHPNLVAIRNMIRRVTQLRRYEVPLEAVEALVRYLGCVHIIVRTAIMIHNLTVLRRQLIVHWRQFRHFIRCDRRFGSPSSHVNCFLRQDGTNLLPEINRGSTRLNRSVNHGVNRTSKKNNLDALECVEVGETMTKRSRSGTRKRDGIKRVVKSSNSMELLASIKNSDRQSRAPFRTTRQKLPKDEHSPTILGHNASFQKSKGFTEATIPIKQIYSL